jgi:hypothetical protein
MKAIILTCDTYLPFTDHLISTYQKIWPGNPFIFRVPYGKSGRLVNNIKDKYGSKVELIQCEYCRVEYLSKPVDSKDTSEVRVSLIKPTVLNLIEDLSDDDWVYWCMDDRYLINIIESKVNEIASWVKSLTDSSLSAILLNRFDNMYESKNLYPDNIITDTNNNKYIQRKNYKRIWNHQFLRVKVLRYLFNEFPDRPFVAKEMDYFKNQIEIPDDQKLYVSEKNYMILGESTSRGKLTKNCELSMCRSGIKIPHNFVLGEKYIVQGEFSFSQRYREKITRLFSG